MRMRDFIKRNREELDKAITRATNGNHRYKNDRERELWVLNDEGLYRWARSEGVRI